MSRPQDQIPIGMFSMVTRLTPRALRLYDEKGILKPERKEPFTGYRYYSYPQIDRAIMIRNLASLGFGLQEISSIMGSMDSGNTSDVEDLFRSRVKEIEKEIDRLEGIRSMLTQKDLRDVVRMNDFQPQVKEVPSLRVLSLREKGTYHETIPILVTDIFNEVARDENRKARVSMVGPAMFICHDKEYRDEDADIEIAVPITGNITVSDRYEVRKLPAAKVASLLHQGPYEEVGPAYQKLMSFIFSKGYKMAGPSRELYLNDPALVPDSELITEIQIPIDFGTC